MSSAAEIVAQCLRRLFKEERTDYPPGMREIARQTGMLPLQAGFGTWTMLRPAGGIVHVREMKDGETPERELGRQIGAIVHATRWFPELQAFVPQKTAAAVSCASCQRSQGGGFGAETSSWLLCGDCGGLGWVDADAFVKAIRPLTGG